MWLLHTAITFRLRTYGPRLRSETQAQPSIQVGAQACDSPRRVCICLSGIAVRNIDGNKREADNFRPRIMSLEDIPTYASLLQPKDEGKMK